MNSKRNSSAATVETTKPDCASVKSLLWQVCFLSLFLLQLATTAQVIELASPDESNPPRGRYGTSVQGLSDLTGDGVGELAVSTAEATEGIAAYGSVYILNGRDFTVVRRLVSPDPTLSGNFGNPQPFQPSGIAESPDLDGDKVPEIIVAALPSGEERSGKDRVYIFSGASGALLQTLFSPDGDEAWYGFAMASLTTTRTNSVPTIVVSSPGVDQGTPGQGAAARIHFFNPVSGKVLFTIKKPDNKRWFGASLAAIGDVDADGREDLAVGAGPAIPPNPFVGQTPPPLTGPGAAYILSGETGRVLHELIPPLPANVTFRWAVAAVPDVNGDGKTDVLVGIGGGARAGAPRQSGHAYLFSGADGKLLRSLISPNETESGGFGWSVAGVPDVTGDGAGELLIGAGTAPVPGFSAFGERRMYLINGATGQTIQSFASPYEGESMGWNVAVLSGKDGKLKNLIAGVRRESRVFAFPLRLLTAARSDEGIRVSFTATDDKSYDLQASSDLKAWMTLTTLNAATLPVTFVDREAKGTNQRFYRAQQGKALP